MEFLGALGVMQPAYALLADKRMSAIGRKRLFDAIGSGTSRTGGYLSAGYGDRRSIIDICTLMVSFAMSWHIRIFRRRCIAK